MAASFINKAYVKKYALQYAGEVRQKKFTRVSKGFIDAIDYRIGEIIRRSVREHPTVGKTLTDVK